MSLAPVKKTEKPPALEKNTTVACGAFLNFLRLLKNPRFTDKPYLAGGFARKWARRLMTLPGKIVARGAELAEVTEGSPAGKFLAGKMPTSLDGMSPNNPGLLALAAIPVAPAIKSHSLIAIKGNNQPPKGEDGVVKYTSAHQDYTESEFIVHGPHTCLNQADTIEEVRRILYLHLDQLPAGIVPIQRPGTPLHPERKSTNEVAPTLAPPHK